MQRVSHGPQEIRCRMLETVRAFVAERLAARADATEIRRRHADCYRRLAEQAAGPLRRGAQAEWTLRLGVEDGNLASAMRFYLAEDPERLPGLFTALLPLWAVNDDYLLEARGRIEQLLPTAAALRPRARAELLLADVVTAREADDATAAAAVDRLVSQLDAIHDPYLHAIAELALGTTSAILGDTAGATRLQAAALAELRTQDEPFWTTLALIAGGLLEIAQGRYDAAALHLGEMEDLAERFGNSRLVAAAHVALGRLSLLQGRPDDAAALLEKALEMSRATQMTRNVSLTLTAYALLAFRRDDPERAALLAGAAEGVRRRAGLRAWPLAPQESDLLAQVRRALGAARYDVVFADGMRLSQREAVASVTRASVAG
jgi:tetratricopeptide (TPR) repeat protein